MHVVVQGLKATPEDAAALQSVCGARAVHAIGDGPTRAFRLVAPQTEDGVAEAATQRSVDCAFVPDDRRLADVRVVSMDMDSTLITIECVDEIGDMLGIKPGIAAITEAAMRGEIDFRASLTRRVGLLAGLPIEALQRVYDERLRLSPGAEAMLRRFHAAGATSLLVSGGFTFFTERLKLRVGLGHTLSNVLDVQDDKLTGRIVGDIVDADAKSAALRTLRESLPPGIAIAIGDGANDLPLFREADVSIAYRAKPIVRAQATHALDYSGLDGVANLFP
ncbi:MAG TPA: phosphoserine phosphatase SerB [Casimicrobiaceae bacterium]|nr:phosphoserine phosphatase SerB [Casimicrobiaceae bacterium]